MDNLVHKTKPNKYKLIKYLFFGAKRKKKHPPKTFSVGYIRSNTTIHH